MREGWQFTVTDIESGGMELGTKLEIVEVVE
jgi:hypothetical protein